MQSLNLSKFFLPVAGIFVIGLVAWRPLTYVTEPGNATVIFNVFGGTRRVAQPGITWITPGVETAQAYNTRIRVWQFTDRPNASNQASNAVSINTSDGQALKVDIYIALKPNVETLDTLHAKIGSRYMETVVVPLVRSKVRDVSAAFDSEAFYTQTKRATIEKEILKIIKQELPTAAPDQPLIDVEAVYIGTPLFPEALTASLEQRQVASISAQTAAVRAKIQERETTRRLILADANRKAIELQGQAAASNAQLGDLLFYERLEERISAAQQAKQPIPLKVIRVEGQNSTVFLNVDPKQAAAIESK